MTAWVLYGLVVDSEIDVRQERRGAGPADVVVRRGGPREPTTERPDGRVLLHAETPERALFTAVESPAGHYVLRFYRTADFVIDDSLTDVEVRAVPGVDEDTLAVLLCGTVLSFVLAMRGEPVLHASAVDVGGQALAFVGASGMGKSTMATLMCADGARLVTDDVLRLDLTRPRPRCYLGATALRLRKAAGDLADLFPAPPGRRLTGDGRDALTVAASSQELLPLSALVVPVPQHGAGPAQPELVQLEKKRALLTLLQFPRLVGWEDPAALDRQLGELAAVVDAVPVYLARLPWGPPFSGTLAGDVTAALGLGVRAGSSGTPS